MDGFEVKIPFDKNIFVSSNELFLRATINRNLEKLLENDLTLAKIIDHYGTGSEFSIQIYKDTRIYVKGDIVIYPEYNKEKTQILNIFLLESLIDNNANTPEYEIVNSYVRDFSASGWREANPLFSIYNSMDDSLNISSFLEYAISDKFYLSHETDLSYHRFGEIHEDTLSSKLLLKNLSNIDDSRSQLFWAYEVGKVDAGNYTGMYKKWGNGIIEYDLTYCLGDSIEVEKTIDNDGSIKTTNYIKANSFIPLSTETCNNDDYFFNAEAYRIFNRAGSNSKYTVNGISQTNVTNQINTYTGTIAFPIPFIDTNYMIFTNSSIGNSIGNSQSPNTVTFTNRKKESITAIYVIPNYNNVENIKDVLLKNNVFQCQILGRWK